DNARFGNARFDFDGPARRLYLIFGVAVLPFAGVSVLAALAFLTIASPALPATVFLLTGLLIALLALLAWLLSFSLAFAWITNWRFNHASLENHRFEADYRAGSYASLVFTNTLAIMLSLGLFYPWAKVRTARYAAEHTRLLVEDN